MGRYRVGRKARRPANPEATSRPRAAPEPPRHWEVPQPGVATPSDYIMVGSVPLVALRVAAIEWRMKLADTAEAFRELGVPLLELPSGTYFMLTSLEWALFRWLMPVELRGQAGPLFEAWGQRAYSARRRDMKTQVAIISDHMRYWQNLRKNNMLPVAPGMAPVEPPPPELIPPEWPRFKHDPEYRVKAWERFQWLISEWLRKAVTHWPEMQVGLQTEWKWHAQRVVLGNVAGEYSGGWFPSHRERRRRCRRAALRTERAGCPGRGSSEWFASRNLDGVGRGGAETPRPPPPV